VRHYSEISKSNPFFLLVCFLYVVLYCMLFYTENRLIFGKVMGKSLVSCFFDSRCSTTFALVPLIIGRQLVELCFSGDLPLTYIMFIYVYLLANKLIDHRAQKSISRDDLLAVYGLSERLGGKVK